MLPITVKNVDLEVRYVTGMFPHPMFGKKFVHIMKRYLGLLSIGDVPKIYNLEDAQSL